jgi:hypothetical protein
MVSPSIRPLFTGTRAVKCIDSCGSASVTEKSGRLGSGLLANRPSVCKSVVRVRLRGYCSRLLKNVGYETCKNRVNMRFYVNLKAGLRGPAVDMVGGRRRHRRIAMACNARRGGRAVAGSAAGAKWEVDTNWRRSIPRAILASGRPEARQGKLLLQLIGRGPRAEACVAWIKVLPRP